MYVLKKLPEDFIVNELSSVNLNESGKYCYFNLKKKDCTTVKATEIISEKFGIPMRFIGFAGNKDRRAVTEQKISILNGGKNFENFKFRNIELKFLGKGLNPISLGDLQGNNFTVTIRNIDKKEIEKIKKVKLRIKIPNLYGPQRFSKNNHLIGRVLLKKDFKNAVNLILENEGQVEKKIKAYLGKNKNDFVGAFRLIPLKIRKMYIHSYQSYLFNQITVQLKNLDSNPELPIIGFELDIEKIDNKKITKIFRKILAEENINPRDFIISQMPEISSSGSKRKLFFELEDFEILEISDDEYFKAKQKVKIRFSLPKSSYATVFIDFVLGNP